MLEAPLSPFPRAVNFHILRACNAHCRYCFATFRDTPGHVSTEEALAILGAVREAGADKMNFVGGEPTLHRDLENLLDHAYDLGFTTSIVSNGKRLGALLDTRAGRRLGWVGLSIDSASDAGNQAVGRGGSGYVQQVIDLASRARNNGSEIKLNTVVTKANVHEDMRGLLRLVRPSRWKVFQALKVQGQNEHDIEPLLVSTQEFRAFVERHAELANEGIAVVAEDNDAMTDSYAMIDPEGRFFGNSHGVHQVGLPILEVGTERALQSVGFVTSKLIARGGVYDWTRRRDQDIPHPSTNRTSAGRPSIR